VYFAAGSLDERENTNLLGSIASRGEMHYPLSMAFSSRIFSKKPEERVRQRCYFYKRPCPSWKSRNFEVDRQGHHWTSHPGWHRIMRDEYKINGQEDTWKEERNRFLQELRRERQFQKQSRRRFSSAF
jgi:hypothetical protein